MTTPAKARATRRKPSKASRKPVRASTSPASPKVKSSRIEARISEARKQLLQQAADLRGESLSDFVLSASHEKAVATLQEAQLVKLSVDDQLRFANALLNPPAAAPSLVQAAERYRERMGPITPRA